MRPRAASVAVVLVLITFGTTVPRAFQTAGAPPLTPATLQGTWVYTSSAPAAREDKRFAGHRIRMYTTQDWFVAQIDPQGGASFLYGGHYTLSGSTLTETVDYADPTASVMLKTETAFAIKAAKNTLTLNGRHALTNPVDAAFDENWERHTSEARPPGSLSPEEFANITLLQQAVSAPAPNLAAAYLTNKNRLEMLALFSKGRMGNANYFLGSEQVTTANAAQMTAKYEHRQDVYRTELRRRGASKVDGRYTMGDEPCPGASTDTVDVDLKQDGFEVELNKAGAAADHLLSGVAVGGFLAVGMGDYDPDMYAFGPIGPTSIVLRPFSGRACGFLLTRK